MTHTLPYQIILWDLDGTLTDPAEGITRCMCYALDRMGVSLPDAATLRHWIGPPLRDTFAAYLGSDTLAETALAHYRERYAPIGMFENLVYPGIAALLAELHQRGAVQLLATAKPLFFAEQIIGHFGLRPYFAALGGASLDRQISTKAQVIATLLEHLPPLDLAQPAAGRSGCVMVGDREHDILGAREHHIPCIAVGYGYGTHDELAACAPLQVVESVAALRAALLGEAAVAAGQQTLV